MSFPDVATLLKSCRGGALPSIACVEVGAPIACIPDFSFQESYLQAIRDSKSRTILVVIPTGGGKTTVGTHIIKPHTEIHKRAGWLVHRWELMKQAAARLKLEGISVGIIKSGKLKDANPGAKVQVCSVATLHPRICKHGMEKPDFDIIFIDEAHHVPARTYREILDQYPDAKIIGLTATPCRTDKKGLGDVFEEMVCLVDTQDLIDRGVLVSTKVYGAKIPSLKGITTTSGDYSKGQLQKRMDKARLIGNILVEWIRHAKGKRTICYASGIEHSRHIVEEFVKFGFPAAHLDGTTPDDEREDILEKFATGEIVFISNYGILTEGFDCPDMEAIVLARPTKSFGLYRQMVGRALRAAPKKRFAIVLDHASCTAMHGFVTDRIQWALSTSEELVNLTAREFGEGGDRFVECHECGEMREIGRKCPGCGYEPHKRSTDVPMMEGELGLINPNGEPEKQQVSREEKERWYRMFKGDAIAHGKNPKSAFYKFQERFKENPPFSYNYLDPLDPDDECRAFVLASIRAYYAKKRGIEKWTSRHG